MQRAIFALFLGVLVGLAAPSRAQDAQRAVPARVTPPDALVAAGLDPLELSRAVELLGDHAVLARLRDRNARIQLAAIRATPALREPEAALAALATFARGRDPDFAPSAAYAALEIASELSLMSLSAHETMLSSLRPVAEAFEQVGVDESVRADIRRASRIVAARVRELMSSAPTP